jgi:hypothetical protein
VLAVPPVQGKAATAHIIRLVESNFFPTDIDRAKVQLRSGGLDRPKDSLVRSVIDHLVFALFEGNAALKRRLRTAVAVRATYELFPGSCEPRIRKVINSLGRRLPDEDLSIFFRLQRSFTQTWGFLEQDNQTRLTELVRQSSDEDASRVLPACLEIAGLEEVCRARISALGHEQLGLLLQETKHPMVVARAVDLYCSSRSWIEANTHYRHVIEPILTELNQAQIFRIFRASVIERADLNGAASFNKFAQYVYDHERVPREEVIATLRENRMEWLIPQIGAKRAIDDSAA